MKETKGVAPIVIAAVIIVATVVAVGAWYITKPEEVPVEKAITITWTEGPEFKFVEDHIHEFEAETGIEVTFSAVPREHLVERVMLELLHPTGAFHAICMDAMQLPAIAATEKLVNLYEFKPKSQWLTEGFYESQLDVTTIGGNLYMIPGFWNGALLLYYRTDYFENDEWKNRYLAWPERTMDELRVPKNPEELLELAKFWDIIEDGVVDGIGPDEKYSTFLRAYEGLGMRGMSYLLPLAQYYGGGVYDYETGEVLVNNSPSLQAVSYISQLMQYAQPTMLNDGTFEAQLNITQGTCIMADQWSYMCPMLDDPTVMKPDALGKYKVAMRPMPQNPDMMGIAILDTPKKELCFEFVEWMNRPEIAKGLVLACPKAPNQTAVAEDPEIAGAEWLGPILDSYGRVQPITKLCKSPFVVEIHTAVAQRMSQVLTGEMTPEAACAAAADDIRRIVG